MSGFAFSHQFSLRWLATPPPVKQTIIQELDDIVTLLQPETELDGYRFSVPNLHDKVEQLMAIEAIRLEKILAEERKREREEQERLEQERLEQQRIEQERLEQERLEQERLAQARLEAERLEQERLEQERLAEEKREQERLEQQRQEQARIEQEAIEQSAEKSSKKNAKKKSATTATASDIPQDDSLGQSSQPEQMVTNHFVERHPSEIVYAISDTQPLTTQTPQDLEPQSSQNIPLVQTAMANPTDIETIKQQIIGDLQVQVEKYLQESMKLMQEDLHKWLTEEVSRQLAVHLPPVD